MALVLRRNGKAIGAPVDLVQARNLAIAAGPGKYDVVMPDTGSVVTINTGKLTPSPYDMSFGGHHWNYLGGCRFPDGINGASRPSAGAPGTVSLGPNGLWLAGHFYQNAIAQFQVVHGGGETFGSLPIAPYITPFFQILAPNRGDFTAPYRITGILEKETRMVVNATVAYDANGQNAICTAFCDKNGANPSIYYDLGGRAFASGWMGPIPLEHQASFGGNEYLMGHSSNWSIVSRLSCGPSLFSWSGEEPPQGSNQVPTTMHLRYLITNPLGNYANEQIPGDPLYNTVCKAGCGFILGDDYIVIGGTGGLVDGIGYKIVQWGGTQPSAGSMPYNPADWTPYYWVYSLSDILNAPSPNFAASPREFGSLGTMPVTALNSLRMEGAYYRDGKLVLLWANVDKTRGGEALPIALYYEVAT